MKTIYNFEMHAPPHLTEAMLQARLEARKKHLQTLLVLLSGVEIDSRLERRITRVTDVTIATRQKPGGRKP